MNSRLPSIVEHRRWFHRHPEVGLHLPRTQRHILDALESAGIEVHPGERQTSIAAVVRGGRADRAAGAAVPTLLVRSDMDALPLVEDTGLDWAATGGAMHACGHDCHMAVVLEAALEVQRRAADLAADCVFFFQPGEEGHGGAELALAEGLLHVSGSVPVAALGFHVLAHLLAPGEIASRAGSVMAGSTLVDVVFRGRGGHGSAPHLARGALTAAAAFVGDMSAAMHQQTDMFEPSVLTFGSLRAGEARNVIPETATLTGVARTFSPDVERQVCALVERVAGGTAAVHGVEAEVGFRRDTVPVTSDPGELDVVEDVLREHGRTLTRLDHPISISEDFSWVLDRIPGAFLLVGAAISDADDLPANHSPRARFSDDVLASTAELIVSWVLRRAAIRETAPPPGPGPLGAG